MVYLCFFIRFRILFESSFTPVNHEVTEVDSLQRIDDDEELEESAAPRSLGAEDHGERVFREGHLMFCLLLVPKSLMLCFLQQER